jgi:glycosyltransferase involved in cell wall biosynthesis
MYQSVKNARIGLNLLYLVPGQTGGTETYARMLIPAIHELRPDLELVAFVGRGGLPSDEVEALGARPVELSVQSCGRFLRTAGEQTLLPLAARREGIALLHNFAGTAPYFSASPQVTTTHDVIYAAHRDAHSPLMRFGQSVLVPIGARRAKRVLTVSEASAGEITRVTGVPRTKIDIVPIAARKPVTPTPGAELRARLGISNAPFIIAPAIRFGHKNLKRLLEGIAKVDHDPAPALVLTRFPDSDRAQLASELEGLGLTGRVFVLGWVSDADMDGLYSQAELLAFPALAEGFGLPLLEAMQFGLPVATSNRSSMPEVGGDAALYFDPYDVDSIASAIDQLLSDEVLREQLGTAGRARAAEFSWSRAAAQTLDAYESLLKI